MTKQRMTKQRKDAIGLFWIDEPKEKIIAKYKVKNLPPARFWESPSYLPNYAEAANYQGNYFTDNELVQASSNKERLVFDIECYPNYFLIAFKSIVSGKIVYFELSDECQLHIDKLRWVIENFTCVSFNGIKYDAPIAALALCGATTDQMHWATEQLIVFERKPRDLLKTCCVEPLIFDHIDLIEVAPLRRSLKGYGSSLHVPRMQDLPVKPGTILSREQRLLTRWYCFNDLMQTEMLHNELIPQIKLREKLSVEYNQDLRSKSDAQIAESVISKEVAKLNRQRCTRPTIEPGTRYKYKVPSFITFQTPELQALLETIRNVDFVVGLDGSVLKPAELDGAPVIINGKEYTVGIGGFHSTEKSISHIASPTRRIVDRDVASYYPSIILNQRLFPKHLGENFLRVYRTLVEKRLSAKSSAGAIGTKWKGQTMPANEKRKYDEYTIAADTLKIVINGSFGKLGSMYSILFAPDLMIQVTISGQLCLLMLIEELEFNGIPVVSANTDGVVSDVRIENQQRFDEIIRLWEKTTNFETEETSYAGLYSRDVNCYVAITTDGKVKVKGAFGTGEKGALAKNPAGVIVSDAVVAYLKDRTPMMATIGNCKDIRKFIHARNVTGGAVKINRINEETGEILDADYLGKIARWYYGTGATGEIVYGKNGNKVPKSDGATPCLFLPETFPTDINYDWYLQEAREMLRQVGLA